MTEERILYMLSTGIIIDMKTLLFGVYGDYSPRWGYCTIRKAIKRLRNYGHPIRAVYGEGYILE